MTSNENLPSFKIDYREFLKGENSYPEYPDGGFTSPEGFSDDSSTKSRVGVNLYNRVTYLSTPPSPVIVSPIIPDIEKMVGWGSGNFITDLMAIGSNGANHGYFYQVDSFNASLTLKSTDTTRQYYYPYTDVELYKDNFYVTSLTDIAQCTADMVTVVQNYWTGTLAQAPLFANPHPMCVRTDILYIADGRYLHQIDNVTVQLQVLDLPDGWIIDCLVVYKNFMYIGAHTASGSSKVYTWDGISDSWNEEYEMDDYVTSLKVFQGVLYAFMPSIISYFDGTKFKDFRPIVGGGLFSSPTVTKFQSDTIWDSMLFIESTGLPQYVNWLNRYGRVIISGRTKNVFTRYISDPLPGGGLNIGSFIVTNGNILYGFGNNNSKTSPRTFLYDQGTGHGLNATGTRTIRVNLNTRVFSTQVKPRKLIAHFDNVDVSAGSVIEYGWIDDTGAEHPIATPSIAGTMLDLTGKKRVSIDINAANATREITLYVNISKGAQLKALECFYSGVETPVNS
jgi:hypothetical protein